MVHSRYYWLGVFMSFVTTFSCLAGNTVIGSYQAPPGGKEATASQNNTAVALPIANADNANLGNEAQFEKRLADALTKNPEIIVKALQEYNKTQQRALQERQGASLVKYKDAVASEDNAIVLGKKGSDVKFVVFLDPNCPHCRVFTKALLSIRENYPNVAVLMRNWPILGKDSEEIVRGLWAIKQQSGEKFDAALKDISTTEGAYTYSKLLSWVKGNGLNVEKFKKDSQAETTKNAIESTKKLAVELGLEGTPTSILIDQNGIRLVLPTDEKSLNTILSEASPKGTTAKT